MTTIHVYKNSTGGKTEFVHSNVLDGPIEDYAELRQEILEIKGIRRLYIYHDELTLQIPKSKMSMGKGRAEFLQTEIVQAIIKAVEKKELPPEWVADIFGEKLLKDETIKQQLISNSKRPPLIRMDA
jgi:hypothetical protein